MESSPRSLVMATADTDGLPGHASGLLQVRHLHFLLLKSLLHLLQAVLLVLLVAVQGGMSLQAGLVRSLSGHLVVVA